jgi:hypothetical protein
VEFTTEVTTVVNLQNEKKAPREERITEDIIKNCI